MRYPRHGTLPPHQYQHISQQEVNPSIPYVLKRYHMWQKTQDKTFPRLGSSREAPLQRMQTKTKQIKKILIISRPVSYLQCTVLHYFMCSCCTKIFGPTSCLAMNLDSWVAYSIHGTSVVVPHRFKYGSGSGLSFLCQC